MAKQITELTTAGAVTPATDLLWIEQGGLPRKITPISLGVPAAGTASDATIRWDGSAWVENGSILSNGGKLFLVNAAPIIELRETDAAANEGNWDITSVAGQLRFRAENDALNGWTNFLTVDRTGTNVTSVNVVASNFSIGGQITGDVTLEALTGDRLAIYNAIDTTTMYGFGIEASTLYNKSAANYRWYIGVNADDGVSDTMELTASALTVNVATSIVNPDLAVGADTALQPWITVDSVSSGDNWTNQGAGISVGESGKKGSAAIHMTYNGDGSGYLGMGSVDNTAATGGRPGFGHFDFTYNSLAVKVGGLLYPGKAGGTTGANSIQSTSYMEDCSLQNYGSINVSGVTGTSGTYAGISVNRRLVMMNNNSTIGGLYNDTNNQWVLRYIEAGVLELNYAGATEAQTANSDAAGATSGLQVRDHNQSFRYAGYQDAILRTVTADFTLDEMDVGSMLYKSSTTAGIDLILPSSTTAFPVGCVAHFMNAGNSTVTINASSQTRTLYWMDGSTRTGGASTNRTIAYGGVISIWRHSTTVYFIWGSGIS